MVSDEINNLWLKYYISQDENRFFTNKIRHKQGDHFGRSENNIRKWKINDYNFSFDSTYVINIKSYNTRSSKHNTK